MEVILDCREGRTEDTLSDSVMQVMRSAEGHRDFRNGIWLAQLYFLHQLQYSRVFSSDIESALGKIFNVFLILFLILI